MAILFAKEAVRQRYICGVKITLGFLILCESVVRLMNVSCYYGMSNGKDKENEESGETEGGGHFVMSRIWVYLCRSWNLHWHMLKDKLINNLHYYLMLK